MQIDVIALALANGFKLKEQPDGSMALNPYVFEFAKALQLATAEECAKACEANKTKGAPLPVEDWERGINAGLRIGAEAIRTKFAAKEQS